MTSWEEAQKVLEDPRYKWRTIRGIANQLKTEKDIVYKLLLDHSDEVVKSSVPAETGEDLYTTRKHYREEASILDKITSSITQTISTSGSSSSSSSRSSSSSSSDYKKKE